MRLHDGIYREMKKAWSIQYFPSTGLPLMNKVQILDVAKCPTIPVNFDRIEYQSEFGNFQFLMDDSLPPWKTILVNLTAK